MYITVQQFSATQPALTLMFDDGNTTDATIAMPTMNQYHFVGTSAIVTSDIGLASGGIAEDGDMTLAQIKSLAADGWEIASHTVDHPDLTTLTAAQVNTELQSSKATLVADGFTVNNIAYPYGAYNAAINANAAEYYTSARTFEEGYNPTGAYPYEIKVQKVIATTTVADVQGWIAEAKAENAWLVIVTHLINATGTDDYHIDPTTFKSIIGAVAQSGIRVITYNQGVTQYAVSPGQGVVVAPPPVTTTPLAGSCSAAPATTTTGTPIVWTATATGGTGTYTYSWTGSNSLTGTTSSVSKTYTSAGAETAQVAITSGTSTITSTCTATVTASSTPKTKPVTTLTANPASVAPGGTSTLTWTVNNGGDTTTTCTASGGWSGSLSVSGGSKSTGALATTTSYTITCTNSAGSTTSTVAVTVTSSTDANCPTGTMTLAQAKAALSSNTVKVSFAAKGSQVTGTIINNSGCGFPASQMSYSAYNQTLADDVLYNSTSVSTVGPHTTKTFTTSIPTCMSQTYIFYGQGPAQLTASGLSSSLTSFTNASGNYCKKS